MSLNIEHLHDVLCDLLREIDDLKDVIQKETELREKAEKERDQAEYDRDYYAKELEKELS